MACSHLPVPDAPALQPLLDPVGGCQIPLGFSDCHLLEPPLVFAGGCPRAVDC
ncbi:unnamed protein product [Ixodes pacificus]